MRWTTLVLSLMACGGGTTQATSDACGDPESAVSFEAADGISLAADWWPAAEVGSPTVVLFHMEPSANDRSNFPMAVRQELHNLGFAVLNVDRRGAGGADGKAADATEGPGALADAEGAMSFLVSTDRDCGIDPTRVVLVGASNGTTLTLDYLLQHDPGLPSVEALIWMSPGDYTTQNQEDLLTIVRNDRGSVSLPLLFLYPGNEPWSETYVVADVPGIWEFSERGEAHGARMFDGDALQEEAIFDIAVFLEQITR